MLLPARFARYLSPVSQSKLPPPPGRAPSPNNTLTRPKLEPAAAKQVWVIESLVKILDQIEMTREISHFPRFFSLQHGFSETVDGGGQGEQRGENLKNNCNHCGNCHL